MAFQSGITLSVRLLSSPPNPPTFKSGDPGQTLGSSIFLTYLLFSLILKVPRHPLPHVSSALSCVAPFAIQSFLLSPVGLVHTAFRSVFGPRKPKESFFPLFSRRSTTSESGVQFFLPFGEPCQSPSEAPPPLLFLVILLNKGPARKSHTSRSHPLTSPFFPLRELLA